MRTPKTEEIRETAIICIIIWLNWSRVKRSILIGFLSGRNFAIQTAKMDHSRSDFNEQYLPSTDLTIVQ